MRKIAFIVGTLCCVPLTANSVEWFESNSPLTQAHQRLLNNDLENMFVSLVEVWQLEHNKNIKNHLNDLLLQALTVDCGKGLDANPLPSWISSINIRRLDIRSPGRDAYQVLVDAKSQKELNSIELTQWVDKPLSGDTTFTKINRDNVTQGSTSFIKRYNLNNKPDMGLYRLDISTSDNESWSTWVIFTESRAKQTVRWASKDQWTVDKNALLNRFCPLPKLDINVYDYIDGKYKEVWSKEYESDYPTNLEATDLSPDRYILAVSMTHLRWQGPISIEQSQVISKTYDISVEE
ncbi:MULTISPECIES: DUF2861 family protein [Vibrio]|jgi:hypothetical protein|uniref:DUF2861 domain-containing protein n=1 Tax=Vibrio diazotrophicus TaxID=685 RepID=A0A2J8HYW4_VIBDI|nr:MULTISPECIES: DUF2861 family protein [Vibrio]MCF7363591.1 DUF2861 family protein [Vibrio sp. A1-b2]MCZ4372507.1 DUF2861 family protein [Vibrio diazotrophicus]PNH81995.1 DUF2861 domain-containing protein [Vibrio diazotrophicus]PNH91782.1 DUF2861 domain-containing protein [Vibrio diazotrophicus]PNH95963.1 DUF2861 domain-containing protein [Vibrio diazotrophicus]